jgi:hypothetical protein
VSTEKLKVVDRETEAEKRHREAFRYNLDLIRAVGLDISGLTWLSAFVLAGRIMTDFQVHARQRCEDRRFPALVTTTALDIVNEMSPVERGDLLRRVEGPRSVPSPL